MYNVDLCFNEDFIFFFGGKTDRGRFRFSFSGRRSAKDLIESFGIPHVEIGSLLINGEHADPGRVIEDGDQVEVLPAGPGCDAGTTAGFLLDVHLGKLAVNLRLLGLDTDYSNDRDDDELEQIAVKSGRILLSCDRGLLMRRRVKQGMVIRSREPICQSAEVIRRYAINDQIRPLTRCANCNGLIGEPLSLDELSHEAAETVPPQVRAYCREFSRCLSCGQVYWRGTHFQKVLDKINRILAVAES